MTLRQVDATTVFVKGSAIAPGTRFVSDDYGLLKVSIDSTDLSIPLSEQGVNSHFDESCTQLSLPNRILEEYSRLEEKIIAGSKHSGCGRRGIKSR